MFWVFVGGLTKILVDYSRQSKKWGLFQLFVEWKLINTLAGRI